MLGIFLYSGLPVAYLLFALTVNIISDLINKKETKKEKVFAGGICCAYILLVILVAISNR